MFKMELGRCFFSLWIVLGVIHLGSSATKDANLVQVNDDNWSQILEGEWMVEFFAPWCPACRSLQPVWEDFSSWGRDLGIQVGQVDITSSPGLTLPTIFHVKEGVFRQYKGPRTKEDFLSYVEEKKWESVEPLSTWQSPSSIQMSLISQFYKISMSIRNLMNIMLEQYGIPPWAAYVIFGLATILLGLILGLILVCIIDFVYPPLSSQARTSSQAASSAAATDASERKKDSDDDVSEEIQDDESQEDEDDGEGTRSDGATADSPQQTRRRRPRKD
ncbi:Thioredoxin-related transmembrane protein 1 [Orchesella cincta]|uniref:Thioredoxin-related transmembrane protein 1 n=1 Tax=Orchesella cincta TaxID=48709 RepID=A0A1D2MMX5_ORCCI|nr:Thioredoxin-related transmembrane protein 1 [Orchesella cincta]